LRWSKETIEERGLDLLAICKELPENNNILYVIRTMQERYEPDYDCFFVIGRSGLDRSACDYTKLDKQKCLELYEINKNS
jgi:hypothetical protein